MEKTQLTPKEVYKIDEVVDFKIKALFNNYCEVIDEKTGITSYLQSTAKLLLFKGQKVECRIIAVNEKHPKIELVNIKAFEQSEENLSEERLTELLEARELSWSAKDFVKLLLTEDKEKSFESKCHRWIQSLLNKKVDLQTVRRDCSDLLELSNLLNICSYTVRDFYQERLTLLIEQIGYYIKAAELIENELENISEETSTKFIDNLFNKLKLSGFVYHPTKNFNILSCIFLRRPDLMNSRIKELLDIIIGKDIRIWKRDPFASALIKLLRLYVSESEESINKTKDNRALIEANMQALAIQLLLMDEEHSSDTADYRLGAARYCTLTSHTLPQNAEKIINTGYHHLFHSDAKMPPYSIDKTSLLPYYISTNKEEVGNIDTVNIFSQGNVRLSVSNEGIHMLAAGDKEQQKPVFPQSLGLWKGLQVFLPTKTETSLASVKPNDIAPYHAVWSEIESELFNTKKTPVATAIKRTRKQHHVDDYVRITFTAQDHNDRNKYYCQIEDEIGGNGFIYVSDIVGYTIQTSLRHFYTSDGCRLVFMAQIIDKEDDLFRFSMADDIKSVFSNDYYTFDEEIICSVGNTPNSYGMSPAVTKEGVSATLINAKDFEGIQKNSIVRCSLWGQGSGNFHITCRIIDFDTYDFDLNTAFKNLMEECSVDKIHENIIEQEEEQMLNNDKLIDEAYVKEIIYMIARMAIIDTEYVKSYNYLGFARILCLLIGWESQAAYYKGRMDIVSMLHDFAQTSRVDEEKLAQLENANAELFSNNLLLKEKFMQLQIVSFIDKPQHNAELFSLTETAPALKDLASLVLAHNIIKANGMESSATDIHNKIINLLNLKGYETGLKKYGEEENEEREYKTSCVFYAGDNRNLPNQEKQMDEILKVINSFFNTRGGKLYIGVNNYGYGVGIEEDLKTSLFYGDKDKYMRSIVDAVTAAWGNKVATTYINIGFDKENEDKDVLIVEVLPILAGLPYKEHWYVRKAGSKRKLEEKDFNEYQEIGRKLNVDESKAETATEAPVAEVQKPSHEPTNSTRQISEDEKIKTSRIRKNVLNSWEDDYIEPIALFKFMDDYKFCKIDEYDYDESTLLTLVVKESEEKGYLVLGYENGAIVKVPIEELLDFNSREYTRNQDCRLIFASLAGEDDAVLTIAKENKSRPKTFMRLDRLQNFETGRLTDSGEIPYNEGLAGEILAYDIVPGEYIDDFRGIIDRPKSSLGQSSASGTKSITNKLHLWGINEI